MSTIQKKGKRKKYPSDISENGWKQLKKQLPGREESRKGGRPAALLKQVINAIF